MPPPRSFKSWLSSHVEHVVFGFAIVQLLALILWWTVFARQLVTAHYAATEGYLQATVKDPTALAQAMSVLHERFERRLFMIAGEGSLFLLLLLVCVATLFVVARQKNRAKMRMERVLAFTTHELKTPIAGVKALLQSLSLGSIPAEARTRLLDQGVQECNRLEHLAETILAYQRAVASTKAPQPLDAKTLLVGVLDHRKRTLPDEQLRVGELTSARVMADHDAFRVIVENLLDNARKYGASDRPVEVSTRASGRWLLVDITDFGAGIEPSNLAHIFDPFTRESRKNTAATHGNGLGLYISQQLAQRMGATLQAHSEGPGKGTTFTLHLRMPDDAAEAVA